MVQKVQTVDTTTRIDVSGIDRRGANELALVGVFDSGGGGSSSANTIEKVRTPEQADDLFGSGTDMANGITDALLSGIPFVRAIGATETNKTDTDSGGITGTIDGSNTTFNLDSADMPGHNVTEVKTDGSAISGSINFTHLDPSAQTVASGDALFNLDTGEFELGTAPSSSVEVTYDFADWDTAFEEIEGESQEIIAAPGFTFQAQHWGVVERFRTEADTNDYMVTWAYNSGVTATDVEAITETYNANSGAHRTFIVAAFYTGDLTSAVGGERAIAPVNGTAKLQVAPLGVSFTDTYQRSDFGDEEDPSDGTFHEFGANAVFSDFDGTHRYSNDRAAQDYGSPATGIRFFSTSRSIRLARVNVEDALLTVRKQSDTAFPFTASGRIRIQSVIGNELGRLQDEDILDSRTTAIVPPPEDLDDIDKEKRIWDDIDVTLGLPGQVHLFKVTINAEL